jgi:F-type H+-transporting ATPase subunit b
VHSVLASNFLVPNGTFIIEVVIFLLVLGFLAKYVLPRLNTMMEERQTTIRTALDEAEEACLRAQEAEAEYRRAMDEARAQARQLIEESNRLGEDLRNQARERADAEYERIIGRAQADIDSSARRAAEELRSQVGDLVVTVVERVIGQALDASAQKTLIDRTIADVEREAGPAGANR